MINETYRAMLGKKSVIRELSELAARMAAEGDPEHPAEIFDYSLGNPSVPVPPEVGERAVWYLEHGDPARVHGYSPTLGIPEVKEKLAASLARRFGIPYTAADIFPTSGAAGALAHAFRLVTQPGDEILTFAPYFPEYGPYIMPTGCGLTVVPADTKAFQIDFGALEAALNPRVQALLINTPNNPSGAVYSEETLKTLAALLERKEREFGHEIWLISDEPYREIVFDGRTQPYPASFWPRTLTCYSFSKSLSMPGDRIGYVAVNPACGCSAELVAMCGQISRGIGHNCPTALMQLVAADCCDLTSDLSVYETNMNLLYDCLTGLGLEVVRPGGTFYMMPKAPEADANAFSRKALRHRLVLVPCDTFALPGYFRIAYCTDTEKVKRSLTAFKELMQEEYGAE
ncbi:MAG: pyridoxal phosphate-dependent aminotransferase [Clostridia bacterium]|nr:pyridoxal phosphate-dependent aminotransferase [Clostridia bacterium]